MWKNFTANVPESPLPRIFAFQVSCISSQCEYLLIVAVRVFQRGEFPRDHVPTIFDTYVQDIRVRPTNTPVQLALWDTAGQEDFVGLRKYSYPDSDVVVICFSLDNYDSLENVIELWQPETLRYAPPKTPFILVGTKKDLRRGQRDGQCVSALEGEAVAKRIGAKAYLECSAKFNEGVEEVFEVAAREAIKKPKGRGACVIL